jgi:Leucine-rich repeat (LRR) protein
LQNKFTGTLSEAIASLTKLIELSLSKNLMVGTLPDSYKALTQLTTLGIASNSLTGTVPASWSSMQHLEEVYMYRNPGFIGCLPHPSLAVFTRER